MEVSTHHLQDGGQLRICVKYIKTFFGDDIHNIIKIYSNRIIVINPVDMGTALSEQIGVLCEMNKIPPHSAHSEVNALSGSYCKFTKKTLANIGCTENDFFISFFSKESKEKGLTLRAYDKSILEEFVLSSDCQADGSEAETALMQQPSSLR